jgi:hypothetical protein
MARSETSVLTAGARLVWQHKRIPCWLFIINAMLALVSIIPITPWLRSVLDHSVYSERLSRSFDVNALTELLYRSDSLLLSAQLNGVLPSLAFLVIALFMTGGILAKYLSAESLSTSGFFGACGSFFCRLGRLLILFVVFLGVFLCILSPFFHMATNLMDSPNRQALGFWATMGTTALLVVALMAVRLWFDMTQLRAVAHNERSMLRCFKGSFPITFGNFGTLFWMYLRISILNWLVIGTGALLWIHVPAKRWGLTLALWEAVAFLGIVARLWQRAGETIWYQRYLAVVGSLILAPRFRLRPTLS